jgi:hypothetical protein
VSFSDEKVQQVWEKASIPSQQHKSEWRKDQCGAWIYRAAYGNRNSKYGWEVHHIDPNGGDSLSNLIPLNWENNVATADTGKLVCTVTSNGAENVKK